MPEFKPSYTGPRGDLARLVPEPCRSFLDVGCATGELGASLKRSRPGAQVVGLNRLARAAALPGLRDLLTFQFVVLGTKR